MSVFYRDIDVNISDYKSELSKPLIVYERDRGLEIYFNLIRYAYRFDNNPSNLLENLVGAYATVTLVNPSGYEISINEVEITEDAKVKFVITEDLTDELTEIGTYQLQIHVNNDTEGKDTSVFSIPPFEFEVRERLKGKKNELLDSEGNGLTDKDGYQLVSATSNKIINFSADKINEYLNSIPTIQGKIKDLNSQLDTNTKKTTNVLTPEMFGAIGDGETDDSDAIQLMFDSAKSGQRIEFKSNTKYKITKTINIPATLEVDGCGCFIILGSELAGQYAFVLKNSKSNAILDTFLVFNEFKNFNIQHYGDLEGQYFNGILLEEQCHVKNIYTWGLDVTIKVSSGIYLDVVTIEGINIWNQRGTNYAIHTGFMGDCRVVKNIHFFDQNMSNKILYIGNGHNTCKVEGVINGEIYVGSSMVELNNLHLEFGNVTLDNSNVTMKNMYIFTPNDKPSIVINGTTNAIIENCLFNYYSERVYSDVANFDDIEIKDLSTSKIHIKNCFKNMLPKADTTFRATNGIRIKNLDDFNKNSLNNSINSIIRGKKVITTINPALRTDCQYNYISAIYRDRNFKWNGPTGTFHYNCCLVYDEERKIGETWAASDMSIALTMNEGSALLHLYGTPNSNLKLYRGTGANFYDKCVMLAPCTNKIYDVGNYVNGTKWEERLGSEIDNYFSVSEYEQNQDGTVTVWANTTPTVGTWKKRDRIINNNIASGNVKSWVFNGISWISEGTY